MPRVNIYIRNDDWDDWQMIDDHPEFIHRSIVRENTEDAIAVRDHIVREGKELGILPEQDQKLCKNGHAIPDGRERCMGKGCKYS